jgi:uncharacterized membrane protein
VNSGTVVLCVVAIGTYALKSAGPLFLGNRSIPPKIQSVIGVMPAALLAALVLVNTVASNGRLVVDARIVGVAAAVAALLAKRGFVTVVAAAAIATAVARRFGMA